MTCTDPESCLQQADPEHFYSCGGGDGGGGGGGRGGGGGGGGGECLFIALICRFSNNSNYVLLEVSNGEKCPLSTIVNKQLH